MLCSIIFATAATLKLAAGVTDIRTSSQAAEALRPVAGAFALFAVVYFYRGRAQCSRGSRRLRASEAFGGKVSTTAGKRQKILCYYSARDAGRCGAELHVH